MYNSINFLYAYNTYNDMISCKHIINNTFTISELLSKATTIAVNHLQKLTPFEKELLKALFSNYFKK